MAEARTVVVTGASRGLGLATATHLYQCGWTVLAAMRTPDDGFERLRAQLAHLLAIARLIGCSARPRRPGVDRDRGAVDPRRRGSAGCDRAQRRYCRRRQPRRTARRRVAASPLDQLPRSRAPYPRTASVDARRRQGPDRRGVEPGRDPRHARDRRVLGRQGGARTMGRVSFPGDRAVRARRHRAHRRRVQDRHARADAELCRPRRALRPAPRQPRAQRTPVPALCRFAGKVRGRGRQCRRGAAAVRAPRRRARCSVAARREPLDPGPCASTCHGRRARPSSPRLAPVTL